MSDLPEYRADPAFLAQVDSMASDANEALMLCLHRISRALDQDVNLMVKAGIPLQAMELRGYGDSLTRSLVVNGKVVREYRINLHKEPPRAQVMDSLELAWTSDMAPHVRALAEAVIDWAEHEETQTGKIRSLTVNTPCGPMEIRRR